MELIPSSFNWHKKQRYTYLLASIAIFLLFPPFLIHLDFLRFVVLLLLANIIWIGNVILFSGSKHKRLGIPVFIIVLVLSLTDESKFIPFELFKQLILLVFFLAITRQLILSVLNSKTVTLSVILGAISAYLLLGLSGALLFQLVETVYPGSYNIQLEYYNFYNMIYYSFVTISTLGYGDILPLTAQARSVAILVSIFGQLYLAILMAMLVGKFLNDQNNERQ